MNEVHHLFKQVQLILSVANTSAYDNALPGLRLQGRRDERLNIVTPSRPNRQDSASTPCCANRAIPTSMASATGLGSHGPGTGTDRVR